MSLYRLPWKETWLLNITTYIQPEQTRVLHDRIALEIKTLQNTQYTNSNKSHKIISYSSDAEATVWVTPDESAGHKRLIVQSAVSVLLVLTPTAKWHVQSPLTLPGERSCSWCYLVWWHR